MSGGITALISGALMSIQGVFNTEVTRQAGIWVSAGWVQLSAFFMCVIMGLAGGGGDVGALFRTHPRYLLCGGILGAFITFTVIRSVDRLGPAKSALLIVISQIAAAWLIELFGLFGTEKAVFEWRKFLGILTAIGGLWIFHM